MKLGTKIILLVVLMVIVTMTVHGYLSIQQEQENILRGSRLGMRSFALAVRTSLKELYADQQDLERTRAFARSVAARGNIHGLIVYDGNARPVVISPSLQYPGDFPGIINPALILQIDPHPVLRSQKAIEGYLHQRNLLVYYRVEPIFNATNQVVGAFVLARHGNVLAETIAERRNRILVTTVALACLLSLLVWFVVRRNITVPINALIEKIRLVARGNWRQRIEVSGKNEISAVAHEFNLMSDELSKSYARLIAEQGEKLKLEQDLRRTERLASVGQLAAGLAHEIGTPLNIISGRAEHLMRRPRSPEEIRDNLNIIVSQSERIAGIVRQLLDFSRRREPLFRPVKVVQLLAKVGELFEHQLAQKTLRVETSCPTEMPSIHADPELLQQVFMNLYTNAIHAARPGGLIKIHVEAIDMNVAGGREETKPGVRIRFEDNGSGIAPEDLGRVFDPFFTTKDIGEGSGLGLSVAFGIIKEHSGEIRVESQRDNYTRFIIELPNLPDTTSADAHRIAS